MIRDQGVVNNSVTKIRLTVKICKSLISSLKKMSYKFKIKSHYERGRGWEDLGEWH